MCVPQVRPKGVRPRRVGTRPSRELGGTIGQTRGEICNPRCVPPRVRFRDRFVPANSTGSWYAEQPIRANMPASASASKKKARVTTRATTNASFETHTATSSSSQGGIILLLVPSTTDINGAGGVAARWREYAVELEHAGWQVELWTVDSKTDATKIPRYHLANFPGTLTDSPGAGFVWQVWKRLAATGDDDAGMSKQSGNTPVREQPLRRKVRCVIMTDLFSNVPLALLCAGANVPLVYSIHTDIAKLVGVNLLPQSAAFLQGSAGRLASACGTCCAVPKSGEHSVSSLSCL